MTNAEQELRSLELNNESTIADLKAYGVITNPYVDDVCTKFMTLFFFLQDLLTQFQTGPNSITQVY